MHSVSHWAYGEAFKKLDTAAVTQLFDLLFELDGDAYSIALEAIGMYVHGEAQRLENLRPQLHMAVLNVHKRPKRRGSQMDSHHFEQMIGWLLKKGGNDTDARSAAAELAKFLARIPKATRANLSKPLLPIMLSAFAPIVWPKFGQAIVKDPAMAWLVEHVLGDSFSFSTKKNQQSSTCRKTSFSPGHTTTPKPDRHFLPV